MATRPNIANLELIPVVTPCEETQARKTSAGSYRKGKMRTRLSAISPHKRFASKIITLVNFGRNFAAESRARLWLLVASALLLGAQSALGATYYVGSCKSGSFPTISAAVSSAPAGSTVKVCPGTYAEQIVISQPLTLEGFTSGDSGQAIIAVPSGGPTVNVHSVDANLAVAAQLLVQDAGEVNITDITVDGTGGDVDCGGAAGEILLVGIFYASGSSGTVNRVVARNQLDSGCGTGIWAENGNTTNETVTIENSSVHNVDNNGILAFSDQSPATMTASIKGNTVELTATQDVPDTIGISLYYSAGSISDNIITGGNYIGILASAPSITVSSNTLINEGLPSNFGGIHVQVDGASITSNKILGSPGPAIYLIEVTVATTVQSNSITNAGTGIDFACYSATVTGNTISDATTGFNDFTAATGNNNFYNVSTVTSSGFCPNSKPATGSFVQPFNRRYIRR